jgi:hypothetical protein
MLHLVRYRHRSLGWSILRSRYRDLLDDRREWWSVLDQHGRFIAQPDHRFHDAETAMAYAEVHLPRHFAAWAKDQVVPKWEQYTLPGGDGYREILLQLDEWPRDYASRHYRTRNVLAHVRTSERTTLDGRRVLFLDEVQSDWHADLSAAAKAKAEGSVPQPIVDAPFHREWPLLAMKLMLWWAQRLNVDGLAWSTVEMQQRVWAGNGPPELLYRSTLPEAGRALAKTLGLACEQTQIPLRANRRRVQMGRRGWEVRGHGDLLLTKPFPNRAQAETFANRTGRYKPIDIPVLWIHAMPAIRSIPLYGVGTADEWFKARAGESKPLRPARRGALHEPATA